MQQGYYQQPPPQQPYGQPQGPYNPEIDSIRSILNITGILAILFAVIAILAGIWYIFVWITADVYYGIRLVGTGTLIIGGYMMVAAIIGFIFFMQCKAITDMVNQGRYIEAKSKTMLWMILGFIFGGILLGILLLIAYLKFDPLIRGAQPAGYPAPPHQQHYQQPQYQQPPPQQHYQQPPPQQGQPPPQQGQY